MICMFSASGLRLKFEVASHIPAFGADATFVNLSRSFHRPRTSLKGTLSCPAALLAASSWVWPHKTSQSFTSLMFLIVFNLNPSSTPRPHQRSSLTIFLKQTPWGECVEHVSMICRNSVISCVTALSVFNPFPDHSFLPCGKTECTPP